MGGYHIGSTGRVEAGGGGIAAVRPQFLCTDLCTRGPGTRRDEGDAPSLRRPTAAHRPRSPRPPETGRDTGDVRRTAHNPEVAGSNPAPATSENGPGDTSRAVLFVRFAGRRTIRVVHVSRHGPHSPSPSGLPKYAAPPRPAAVVDERHRSTPCRSTRSTDSPCLADTCKARPAFGFSEPYLKISRIYQVFFRCHNESRWLLLILTRVWRPAPSGAAGSR